jgi:hypothetical protein
MPIELCEAKLAQIRSEDKMKRARAKAAGNALPVLRRRLTNLGNVARNFAHLTCPHAITRMRFSAGLSMPKERNFLASPLNWADRSPD